QMTMLIEQWRADVGSSMWSTGTGPLRHGDHHRRRSDFRGRPYPVDLLYGRRSLFLNAPAGRGHTNRVTSGNTGRFSLGRAQESLTASPPAKCGIVSQR